MVPIFAQRVLQFTATQTGQLMLPGALASAVAMALLGKNAHRLDPRWLISLGAVLMVATMMQLSAIGTGTGEYSLYRPLISGYSGIQTPCFRTAFPEPPHTP